MISYDFVSKNRTLETNASPKPMQTISKMEIPREFCGRELDADAFHAYNIGKDGLHIG